MDLAKFAKVMKALGCPKRAELYLEIVKKSEADYHTGGTCFISEIIGSLNIGAPTISHHLKELANAELITTEKRGKFLVAKVNDKTARKVANMLRAKDRKR
jgi:DNA-binding transcriptional ArsR family regulator